MNRRTIAFLGFSQLIPCLSQGQLLCSGELFSDLAQRIIKQMGQPETKGVGIWWGIEKVSCKCSWDWGLGGGNGFFWDRNFWVLQGQSRSSSIIHLDSSLAFLSEYFRKKVQSLMHSKIYKYIKFIDWEIILKCKECWEAWETVQRGAYLLAHGWPRFDPQHPM